MGGKKECKEKEEERFFWSERKGSEEEAEVFVFSAVPDSVSVFTVFYLINQSTSVPVFYCVCACVCMYLF